MPKPKRCRAVDAEFATGGPNTNTLVRAIAAPADDLFRCLEDGPAWKEWLGIDVVWTSNPPHGVGTTRTVTNGRLVIDEYFLLWEAGRRMNFRFDRSTLPVSAFAEDYRVVPTGDDTCELHWSYSFEWRGFAAPLATPLFARFFARNGRKALDELANLMATSGDRFTG